MTKHPVRYCELPICDQQARVGYSFCKAHSFADAYGMHPDKMKLLAVPLVELPLVSGGQGRSTEQVCDSATAIRVNFTLAFIVLAIICYAL